MNYEVKVGSLIDTNKRWDYLVASHPDEKENWEVWKKNALFRQQNGISICYYGFLDDVIIGEATAIIKQGTNAGISEMIDGKTAYLQAFRIDKEYENKGYFSKIFEFMIEDLKSKGFNKVFLAVEPCEERNKSIYEHYGFTTFIKRDTEEYPNGEKVVIDYYSKDI